MVESAPVLAFDLETTGTDAHKDYTIGWVFANKRHSLYIPVRHAGGGNDFDDPEPFERRLAAAFALRERRKLLTIGFALHFDLWFAAKHGVVIGAPLEDCQLNEVLIRDNLGRQYNLDESCERRHVAGKAGEGPLYEKLQQFAVAAKGKKAKPPSRANMQYFHMLPGDDPMVTQYAEGDGIATYALWEAQQPILDRDELRRVWKLECDLLPYVAQMRRRGMRVDTSYGQEAIRLIEEEKARRRSIMNVPADWMSKSPLQVATWLFEHGVERLPQTPTGKWSTRKAVLERLEAGRMVLDLRKAETAETGFIRPLIDTHLHKGRVHCELVQSANSSGGTHTGRFSSRNPNLQAYPKRDRFLGNIIRPLIVPDEGMLIGEADVSQQEPRLYAHIADESKLLAGYNSTPFVDVHTITSQLMGIPRDAAKTIGLSLFNGMGANTLASRLNVTEAEARKLRFDFFAGYPDIWRFVEAAPKIALQQGFVRTILGRRAYFDTNHHMAVSRTIQGGAADQMKTALLQALQYCDSTPNLEILMTIHDSVLFQATPDADLGEFRRVLEDMSNFYQIVNGKPVPMKIPFPVDIGVGANWALASYGAKA